MMKTRLFTFTVSLFRKFFEKNILCIRFFKKIFFVHLLLGDLLIAEVLPKIVKQFIESREEPVSIGDLADRLTGLEDLIKEEFEQTMSLKDTYMKKIEDLATRVFRE